MKILITSGPTRAYIDEIRYISNYSTGNLGTCIAKEAVRKRNKVTFVYGKGSNHPKNKKVKLIEIQTIDDLVGVLKKELRKEYDAVIHSMAVLDYAPAKQLKAKIKSDRKNLKINLKRTPKIINLIKKIAPKTKLIGFKLEYGISEKNLKKSGQKLLKENNADFVVANDYKYIKKGRHTAMIIGKEGIVKNKVTGKANIAKAIISVL